VEICVSDRAVSEGVGSGGTNSVEVGRIVGRMIGGMAVGVCGVAPTSATVANGGIEVGAI
jgi:hypothetical protein